MNREETAITGLKANNNPRNQSERRPSRSTCIVFPLLSSHRKEGKTGFPNLLLAEIYFACFLSLYPDGNLIKRSGEKAMSLCFGLNFGPITWAIIDPR